VYNKVNALLFEMQDLFYPATRTLNVFKPYIKHLISFSFYLQKVKESLCLRYTTMV